MVNILYSEPSLPVLLTFISFFYFLQVFRNATQWAIGVGLIGEVALGIIYSVASLFEIQWEQTLLILGYIGLVLIVFEGGLDVNPHFLPALPLASLLALVGVLLPFAFTFALFSGLGYRNLEAFACASALATTSLGTTFSILKSFEVDLTSTRIGTTLVAAALVDDVVSLVLLSVIQEVGGPTSVGWAVGRPVLASLGLAIVGPAVSYWVFRPIFRKFLEKWIVKWGLNGQLFLGAVMLSGFLAVTDYAGTTVLIGAFIAGANLIMLPSPDSEVDFRATYRSLVGPVQDYIFSPLFFASIGFAIPFVDLFTGPIIWKGIVYSILMGLGKVLVGFGIIIFDLIAERNSTMGAPILGKTNTSDTDVTVVEPKLDENLSKSLRRPTRTRFTVYQRLKKETFTPALFLGSALVARGEIGASSFPSFLLGLDTCSPAVVGIFQILVLQVAFAESTLLSEEPYLVAVWAVALNTIVGPVVFNAIVKRGAKGIMEGKWGQGAS